MALSLKAAQVYETQRCYLCPEVFLSSEEDAPNTVDTVAASTMKSNVLVDRKKQPEAIMIFISMHNCVFATCLENNAG